MSTNWVRARPQPSGPEIQRWPFTSLFPFTHVKDFLFFRSRKQQQQHNSLSATDRIESKWENENRFHCVVCVFCVLVENNVVLSGNSWSISMAILGDRVRSKRVKWERNHNQHTATNGRVNERVPQKNPCVRTAALSNKTDDRARKWSERTKAKPKVSLRENFGYSQQSPSFTISTTKSLSMSSLFHILHFLQPKSTWTLIVEKKGKKEKKRKKIDKKMKYTKKPEEIIERKRRKLVYKNRTLTLTMTTFFSARQWHIWTLELSARTKIRKLQERKSKESVRNIAKRDNKHPHRQ